VKVESARPRLRLISHHIHRPAGIGSGHDAPQHAGYTDVRVEPKAREAQCEKSCCRPASRAAPATPVIVALRWPGGPPWSRCRLNMPPPALRPATEVAPPAGADPASQVAVRAGGDRASHAPNRASPWSARPDHAGSSRQFGQPPDLPRSRARRRGHRRRLRRRRRRRTSSTRSRWPPAERYAGHQLRGKASRMPASARRTASSSSVRAFARRLRVAAHGALRRRTDDGRAGARVAPHQRALESAGLLAQTPPHRRPTQRDALICSSQRHAATPTVGKSDHRWWRRSFLIGEHVIWCPSPTSVECIQVTA
jgi:hypothetical protein